MAAPESGMGIDAESQRENDLHDDLMNAAADASLEKGSAEMGLTASWAVGQPQFGGGSVSAFGPGGFSVPATALGTFSPAAAAANAGAFTLSPLPSPNGAVVPAAAAPAAEGGAFSPGQDGALVPAEEEVRFFF